jgi:hypothetical protein
MRFCADRRSVQTRLPACRHSLGSLLGLLVVSLRPP